MPDVQLNLSYEQAVFLQSFMKDGVKRLQTSDFKDVIERIEDMIRQKLIVVRLGFNNDKVV